MFDTKYVTFEIKITNAKNGKTEYRDYAITVKDNEYGDKVALDAVNEYAKKCISRLRNGSAYTVTKL
jgi:hypothetical protein